MFPRPNIRTRRSCAAFSWRRSRHFSSNQNGSMGKEQQSGQLPFEAETSPSRLNFPQKSSASQGTHLVAAPLSATPIAQPPPSLSRPTEPLGNRTPEIPRPSNVLIKERSRVFASGPASWTVNIRWRFALAPNSFAPIRLPIFLPPFFCLWSFLCRVRNSEFCHSFGFPLSSLGILRPSFPCNLSPLSLCDPMDQRITGTPKDQLNPASTVTTRKLVSAATLKHPPKVDN